MNFKICVISAACLLLTAACGNDADPGQASGAKYRSASPQLSTTANASPISADAGEGGVQPLWQKHDGSGKVQVLEDGLKLPGGKDE
ncbi:hypothetical protein LBW89_00740 [Paenibacillus sp. alder61]|uniref:hypothetical protein n=1 Tax=Paenibacillus sp. alder61 TaxID=2862948 RepID=UPI001CD23270|nr:hypothetical protein [Paenibacillus sp. alder61]MCA1291536.1 hypothetical protein [Paenibacillus sp. alder61]